MKCKCVKGIDGFTWGETYDVKFNGSELTIEGVIMAAFFIGLLFAIL